MAKSFNVAIKDKVSQHYFSQVACAALIQLSYSLQYYRLAASGGMDYREAIRA
jgi:hypothetical protein